MKDISNARSRLLKDLSRDPGILILAYPYARTWCEISHEVLLESWSRLGAEEQAAVYAHIPFCRRKCKFCDFLAYYGRSSSEIDEYMALLHEEVRLVAHWAGHVEVKTVHLGGGTPSLLSADKVASFLDKIASRLKLQPNAQVTMEVFPDSQVTKEQLSGWKKAGVNRLSFGFQFYDDDLKASLNRTDWTEDNLRLFHITKEIGYEDVNIDLMCGLPEQSSQSWRQTLLETTKLYPSHICVFPVSVRHPGIPLFKEKSNLPSVDKTRQMYNEAVQILSNSGYTRTTRHNFVRSGFEYLYERMIAGLSPLIGVGANSISYSRDCIYRNCSDLLQYASAISSNNLPIRSGHLFPEVEKVHNYAVRQIEYLRLRGAAFQKQFGLPLSSVFDEEIQLLEEMGLAELTGQDLALTEEGIYFTSAVKRLFFHESAWNRLHEMKPEDFKIERSSLAREPLNIER
jgi:oxygen-independent coproporphyrinogen-3 oxidase